MSTISAELKKLLFNKEENDPLTEDEQEAWDDFLESEQSQWPEAGSADPATTASLQLYRTTKADSQFSDWKKFEKEVLKMSKKSL